MTSVIHSSGFTVIRCDEHGGSDGLDVLGQHVVPTRDHRQRPGAQHQRQRAAGGGADEDVAVGAARRDQGDAVLADAAVDLHLLDGRLHLEQAGRVGHRVEHHLLALPGDPGAEDVVLLLLGGVPEADAQQEPVELGLGERVGAFVLDRVGGGQHVERGRQLEGAALDGDLPFLHGLEQRGLRLRWRAVDLVGEQEAGEQRALPELEVPDALVVDERAGEVGRQQVGGELGARELDPQCLREGACGQGLAEPREVLQQHVATAEDARQDETQGLGLADHDRTDPVQHRGGVLAGGLDARAGHSSSILRTASPSWATE